MKHRRIVVSGIVLALVFLSTPALAEEGANAGFSAGGSTTPLKVKAEMRANIEAKRASSTERREDTREKMLERKASTTERIQERKASSTARRVEFQQNLAKRQVEHVTKVMLATIERLEKIIVRIESRIAKIEAEGGNTEEAEGFVADAKVNLTDAEASVNAFASIELTSDKAKENFEKVRNAAAEAREHIRMARENLMKAIRSLGSVKASVRSDNSVE
ncbi:MAG: hypothetical protein AAB719_01600 [Patescibacteria group bacterium]